MPKYIPEIKIGNETYKVKDERVDILNSEISELTNNLFDLQSVTLGMNGSGASASARAISGPIYVGSDKAMIKAVSLPANLKYDVEWYSAESISTHIGGSAWKTDDSVYDYTGTYPYIRILFGTVNNAAITVADFSGLQLQVNRGTVIKDFETHLTAKDIVARAMTEMPMDIESPNGLLPIDGWEQGSLIAGVPNGSLYRIHSDYVEVEKGAGIKISNYNAAYDISFQMYDSSKTYITDSGYPSTYPSIIRTNADTKYIRFVVKNHSESIVYPNDVYKTRFKVTHAGENTQPFNLKVMTYNIGRYSYGVEPFGLNSNNYSEKLTNYRRFFGAEKCDIVCLQEWDRIIKYGSPDIEADTVLFSHWYPYNQNTGNYTAIKSKYWLQNANNKQLETSGRYYTEGNITVGDKCVYVLDVHLSPGYDSASETLRYNEVTEVLGLVADKERFIIFGDFNPNPSEYKNMYKRFTDLGYNAANGGFFGDFWTWTTNQSDFDSDTPTGTLYYVDNIITSSNIQMINVNRVNAYSKLTSDHIPIIAELSIQ